MEEPRKVLKAKYVGSLQVNRPNGMDVLNDAIDQMVNEVPADQWRDVNVAIAPSVVTITDVEVRFIVRLTLHANWIVFFTIFLLLTFSSQYVSCLTVAGRGETHCRVAGAVFVVPRHRSASGTLRIHRAHGQRRVHRSRHVLPAVVGRNMQDDRGGVQGE